MSSINNKPECKLSGENGNIFHLLAVASRTLKENGLTSEADEMWQKATSSSSYEEALSIIGDYVTIC